MRQPMTEDGTRMKTGSVDFSEQASGYSDIYDPHDNEFQFSKTKKQKDEEATNDEAAND